MGALVLTWRELTWPTGFDADQAMVFTRLLAMRPLHGMFRQPDPVVCEIVATAAGLGWRLGLSGREAALLLPQLRAQLASVGVEPAERALPPLDWAIELRLDSATRPLRTDVAEPVAAALLTALSGVHRGEALVLSWVIGPWLARPAVAHGDTIGVYGPPLSHDEAAAMRTKYAEPLYGAVARIGVHASGVPRRIQLAQRVLGALEIARAAGAAFAVRSHVSGQRAAKRLTRHAGPLFSWPVVINAAELAAVIGFPCGNPTLPTITYNGHRQLPANTGNWVPATTATTAPPGRYRLLGTATRGGYIHLPAPDALHHLHVVGPTGSGKSVLLAHLIDADIHSGRSVVVVEPKADLIAAVADRIPPHRTHDVVLIDPTDTDHAVGLNVLGGNPELAADRFVHVIRNLSESWGPRTSQVLHAAALTLARTGGTLADLPHLLSDPAYRTRLLQQAPDPLGTGPFWAWFNALSDNERSQVIGPSLHRLSAFTGRPAIRAVIGQTDPRFALTDLFTGPARRVLLVNLAKGIIGPESARLFGSLLLAQLWQAALARAATPPDRRRAVTVFVDEFQDYTTGLPLDFGDVLSQARGLGVGFTVAHQGLHQLDPTTRAGVMANARSRLVFQTPAPEADARALAAGLGYDITPADLAALDAWEAYATLVHDHATNPPASLVTLPPQPALGTTQTIRETSRDQWARPTADIEAALLARRQSPAPLNVVGRRPRTIAQ